MALARVVFLNDDYTPVQFVTSVLEEVFKKTPQEAIDAMLSTHRLGRYAVATLERAEAEAAIQVVHDLARENRHPFRCVLEPDLAA